MCKAQNKRMYSSYRAAIGSALASSKKRGTPLRVYYHHACKSFHLTKQPLADSEVA